MGLAMSIVVALCCYWIWSENEASHLACRDGLAESNTTRVLHQMVALVQKGCDAGESLETCLQFVRERVDGWERPLGANVIAGRLKIVSCGRDGEFGTLDDIVIDVPLHTVQVDSRRDK